MRASGDDIERAWSGAVGVYETPDHRFAGGDPANRVGELADVGHPVLKQVADAARIVGQQLDEVLGFHELGQHRRGGALPVLPDRQRRLQSFGGLAGGIRMSARTTWGRAAGDHGPDQMSRLLAAVLSDSEFQLVEARLWLGDISEDDVTWPLPGGDAGLSDVSN